MTVEQILHISLFSNNWHEVISLCLDNKSFAPFEYKPMIPPFIYAFNLLPRDQTMVLRRYISDWGRQPQRWGRQPINWPIFSRQLHDENERIWTEGARVPGAPLDPPLHKKGITSSISMIKIEH